MKVLSSFDFAQGQLKNPCFQVLGAAPSSPALGQFYYDSGGSGFGYWNGSAWVYPSAGAGLANAYSNVTDGTTTATASGGDTLKFRSANAAITAVVGSNDATHGDNLLMTFVPSAVALSSFGTPSADVSMNSHKLTSVTDPTSAQDAATKAYVDAKANGIAWMAPVVALATSNQALTGLPTVDGVTLTAAQRILLTAQTTASQNGVWLVASGAWSRPTDYPAAGAINPDAAAFVSKGTTYSDTGWVMTNDSVVTVDTTSTTWVQFTGVGEITAGTGIVKSGQTLSIDPAYGGNTSLVTLGTVTTGVWSATTIAVAKGGTGQTAAGVAAAHAIGAMGRYAGTIGNGSSTSIAVTHSLGTKDVVVSIRDASTDDAVACDWTATDVNTVTFKNFTTAPGSNALAVVIIG